ncbi:MAG: hypothetical protein PHT91_00085 [Candidatus Nanoarchaeia archaeon]|nr:hypothetical protein [Candidatus Nanoarchaeia archaeon]MDD5054139.1 hypothetical protein [Candidatus Nanoarchaeia archaeon]MDD5499260.1 hypothetical protein [Candidatus Nanoarchaeia archaeon]
MMCNKCGSEMTPMGFVNLQDDYAEKEEIFCNAIERFKCSKCEELIELRKKLN